MFVESRLTDIVQGEDPQVRLLIYKRHEYYIYILLFTTVSGIYGVVWHILGNMCQGVFLK